MVYNWRVFGVFSPIGGYGDYVIENLTSRPITAMLLDVVSDLVHMRTGVLFLSPFLIVLLPGLRQAWLAAPTWVRSLTLAAVAYSLLQRRGLSLATGSNSKASYFWGRLSHSRTPSSLQPLIFENCLPRLFYSRFCLRVC